MTRSRTRSPRGIPETPPGFWDIDGLTPPRSPSPSSAAVRAAVAAGDQRALAIAISAAIDRALQRNAMLAARAAASEVILDQLQNITDRR